MGSKILFSGLTMMMALDYVMPVFPWQLVGAIFMIIGTVLMVFDK